MGIPLYLAMTAAEMRRCDPLPEKAAWMACHFSPYGTGLTNLPRALPEGSLLILNDRTPISGHDPAAVRDTLEELAAHFHCVGLLLDLQQPPGKESQALAAKMLSLPFPVCAPPEYSMENAPVFLPPVPLLQTAAEYLSPWQGREIWLEAALDGVQITVTENGTTAAPLPPGENRDCYHFDEELMCHYRIDLQPGKAVFTLRRTRADLNAILELGEDHGATCAIGLWQELGRHLS